MLMLGRFLQDLSRWRFAVCEPEQRIFDRVSSELWSTTLPLPESSSSEDELRFQSLAQNILSDEDEEPWKPSANKKKCGRRLRDVQTEVEHERRSREKAAAQQRGESTDDAGMQNIGSILSKLTKDTDSAEEDDIEWADYIHLSALEEESSSGEGRGVSPEPPASPIWKETEALVGNLLASPTFAMILGLVTSKLGINTDPVLVRCFIPVLASFWLTDLPAVREGYDDSLDDPMLRVSLDTQRPSTVLEKFLGFNLTPRRGLMRRQKSSEGHGGRARMARMKANSRKPPPRSHSHSLNNSFGSPKSHMRASMSSPG